MRRNSKNRVAALAGTLAFHAIVIIALIAGVLRYSSEDTPPEWPPADSAELLLGGEWVMAGEVPESSDIPAAPAKAESEPATEPLLSSPEPSPAKVKPVTEDKRDKAADPEAAEKAHRDRERAEREKTEAARISSRVAFGKGKTGSPDGNAATGAVSGVGTAGLGNRRPLDLPRPPRGPMGRIIITIKVDRAGNVTSAAFLGGEGAAAASSRVRAACVAAARRARFSASEDAPASQTGTLTYNFK